MREKNFLQSPREVLFDVLPRGFQSRAQLRDFDDRMPFLIKRTEVLHEKFRLCHVLTAAQAGCGPIHALTHLPVFFNECVRWLHGE